MKKLNKGKTSEIKISLLQQRINVLNEILDYYNKSIKPENPLTLTTYGRDWTTPHQDLDHYFIVGNCINFLESQIKQMTLSISFLEDNIAIDEIKITCYESKESINLVRYFLQFSGLTLTENARIRAKKLVIKEKLNLL